MSDVCCIKGCDSKVLAAGLCNRHWRRNKKYGSPVLLRKPNAGYRGLPVEIRFFMRVKKTGDCWLWLSGKDNDGYGLFFGEAAGAVYKRAHRWSWAHHNNKPVPTGMQVCHSCDNPICVNPAHLRVDTCAENQREKWRKGRGTKSVGEMSHRAKLTESDVRAIRASNEHQIDIAKRLGIHQSTVSDIKRRRSWAHIE